LPYPLSLESRAESLSALDTNNPPNNGLPGFRAHLGAPKKREQTQAQEEDPHQRRLRRSSCMRGCRRHIRGGPENRWFVHENWNPNRRSLREATRGPKLEAGGNDLQLRGVQREMPENPRRGSGEGPQAHGAQGPAHGVLYNCRERGEQSLQPNHENGHRVGR